MFESAEQIHKINKSTFKAEEQKLREALLDAQFDLAESKSFAVLILLTGLDGAGKSEALARLTEWFDPRHVHTRAFDAQERHKRADPPLRRFWLNLPAKGRIGIFLGSWYADAFTRHVLDDGEDSAAFEHELAAFNRFEAMLAAEQLLLVKLWLHMSPADQKKRLAKIAEMPGGGRHVVEYRRLQRNYDRAIATVQQGLRLTSTGESPWVVIPSADAEYRDIMIGQTVLAAMRSRLDAPATASAPSAPVVVASIDHKTALDGLDLSRKLERDAYKEKLAKQQQRLANLTDSKDFRKIALVATFEGNDAAGKGGSIRRVTQAIDPRRFRVHAIAAPTEEERAQPYLWRFWRRMPRRGEVAIFDRTWYGRVLVERVEGFCSEADWLRAYAEINDFEAQLTAAHIVVVKFWLATSKEEQLRRFQEREQTPYKRFKITDEDWRNRDKWDAYANAVGDMIDRTSSEHAPWVLVSSEDKLYARVKILKTINDRLEAAMA